MYSHLDAVPAAERPDLLGAPVAAAICRTPSAVVFRIDPGLADTAALCEHYGLPLNASANCVLVTGKRSGQERHVACLALATTRVDVNGLVRKRLQVRKASFSSRDFAVTASGMQYGAITPVGLPADWPIWIDDAVPVAGRVVIGSGVRESKLIVNAAALVALPGAEVVPGLAR
ncbi:MAG: hypothetical protein CSA58_10270 [Micrococcales bacterium]|nr:MAG: hypothetical protein CSB46_08305 [Micrococcales bacterium]PIE26290.1 MAG: hypothetical protein CSA58_10270 [Micrococcales bacterium]